MQMKSRIPRTAYLNARVARGMLRQSGCRTSGEWALALQYAQRNLDRSSLISLIQEGSPVLHTVHQHLCIKEGKECE